MSSKRSRESLASSSNHNADDIAVLADEIRAAKEDAEVGVEERTKYIR